MIPSATVASVACTLSVALAILGALHLYWAFGGSWGLAAALGRDEIDPNWTVRLAAGAVAIALLVVAVGVLGRIGLWGAFLPWLPFSWGTWVLATALFLAALLNLASHTWLERLVFAPIALGLGVLALIIARSPRPYVRTR
jgi:sterol desaturase/sphingolipid hydroxylase (fatty acid hydroxylase superfamily)